MTALLGTAVGVIALGFALLIWVINSHLHHLRRDFADLKTFLIAILGDR